MTIASIRSAVLLVAAALLSGCNNADVGAGMLKLTPPAEMERVAALADQSRCERPQ